MSTRQIIVANRIALPAEPPEEIWLMPWGSVAASNGDFVVNDESRRAILERIDHRGVELVIDYEHHTVGGEFAAPDGRAVAAGWIKSLRFARDGDAAGVYAGVEWTFVINYYCAYHYSFTKIVKIMILLTNAS